MWLTQTHNVYVGPTPTQSCLTASWDSKGAVLTRSKYILKGLVWISTDQILPCSTITILGVLGAEPVGVLFPSDPVGVAEWNVGLPGERVLDSLEPNDRKRRGCCTGLLFWGCAPRERGEPEGEDKVSFTVIGDCMNAGS